MGQFVNFSRVPEIIKEAKDLVKRLECDIEWEQLESGYKIAATTSN